MLLQNTNSEDCNDGIEVNHENELDPISNPKCVNFDSVLRYTDESLIYAMNWTVRPDHAMRLGVCQCVNTMTNKIKIVEYSEEHKKIVQRCDVKNGFPVSKLIFIPDKDLTYPDLFAVTDDFIKVYKIVDNKSILFECKMRNLRDNRFAGPFTACDWNPIDMNLLAASSIDYTCTIFDIHVVDTVMNDRVVWANRRMQFCAHDKEALDIGFKPDDKNILATCGADGSLRLFDSRDMQQCSVLYENPGKSALVHLQWNPSRPYCLSTFPEDSSDIYLLDVRMPIARLVRLQSSTEVSAFSWNPTDPNLFCTGDEEGNVLIWRDTGACLKANPLEPVFSYKSVDAVSQVRWSPANAKWIASTFNESLELLMV